jgi:hypothetical protein
MFGQDVIVRYEEEREGDGRRERDNAAGFVGRGGGEKGGRGEEGEEGGRGRTRTAGINSCCRFLLVKGADYTLTNFHKLGTETIRHTPRYEEEGIER